MMNKVIVILRSTPSVSIEVPNTVVIDGNKKEIKRSCFGALRLFPGVPKSISKDELEYIKNTEVVIYSYLEKKQYVESKRIDIRGASEADIEKLAKDGGLDHLKVKVQLQKLQERGKLKRPDVKDRAVRLKKEHLRTTRKSKNGSIK